MKSLLISFLCLGVFTFTNAQNNESIETIETIESSRQLVDASCGKCNFDMAGKSCELAVMIDGKSYYVDGANIHDHGDAHGKHGMCSAVRKAYVEGEVVEGKFQATSFELLPVEIQERKKK